MRRARLAVAFLALATAAAAAQDIAAGRTKAQVCTACHGADGNGNSAMPEVPILAGQTWRYLYIELRDFKEGRRSNPIMSPMAQPLSRDDMIDVANYFASLPLRPQDFKVDENKAKLGKAKADETLCTMCHLGGFLGQNEIPRVAGQNYQYIVAQLKAFKDRTRTNDAGNMTAVSRTLSDEDIENLGHYLAGLH
jgi:cytochrome c553